MPIYHGKFSNKTGTYSVAVHNDYRNFYFQIGVFKFQGFDLDAFELCNPEDFTATQLEQFDLVTRQVREEVYLDLTQYQLSLQIPQILIDSQTQEEKEVMMELHFELMNQEEYAFLTFQLDDKKYEAKHSLMELLLDDIQRQFEGNYRFKNCYGCLYGDYSVYGQGFMGPVLCFKNQKKAYLEVQNKSDYMHLEKQDTTQQELFCCESYACRDRVLGYRGTVL
ncbi:DUF6304 family protein [Myroides odoratus]|uniref:DUF6304 family protein n=1 Tax=Myroides odoratus TaxID=256 RepID=UPI003340B243